MLRAANSNIRHKVGLKPGPFDASALKESGADATNTLITGLLVIYPLVASAGAVLGRHVVPRSLRPRLKPIAYRQPKQG